MRAITFRAALAALVLLAGARPGAAAGPGCLSCHQKIQGRAKMHGPAAMGTCDVCHVAEKPDPAKHHTFGLVKEQPELCLSCHEDMKAKLAGVKVAHGALDAGGCTPCHDPHGSSERFFIKESDIGKLCAGCHEPKTGGKVVHPPARQSCTVCHLSHGGPNAKLLSAPPPALCLDCHAEVRADLRRKDAHPPAKAGCTRCHEPHSGARAKLLKADPNRALCVSCHKKIEAKIRGAKRPHKALDAGCPSCHAPHGSAQAKLLKAPIKELCIGCHEAQRKELVSPFLHGPVRLAYCQGCHDPHGAANPWILKTFFPQEFYNDYKEGLYALCFNCHDKHIATDARTTTLTGFRNGDENLHFVHVNRAKGRSCKACHAVHGGTQEKHVRGEVPFGSWMLPIAFVRTANGGNCTVGCHAQKAYDRASAVDNP